MDTHRALGKIHIALQGQSHILLKGCIAITAPPVLLLDKTLRHFLLSQYILAQAGIDLRFGAGAEAKHDHTKEAACAQA